MTKRLRDAYIVVNNIGYFLLTNAGTHFRSVVLFPVDGWTGEIFYLKRFFNRRQRFYQSGCRTLNRVMNPENSVMRIQIF